MASVRQVSRSEKNLQGFIPITDPWDDSIFTYMKTIKINHSWIGTYTKLVPWIRNGIETWLPLSIQPIRWVLPFHLCQVDAIEPCHAPR